MNRKLARKVAREHKVSVAEVRRGVAEALDHAYAKPNFHARRVCSAGEKPTANEFIAHAVREAKTHAGRI